MKRFLFAILALAVAGCSSVGTPISKDKVNQIAPGVTTEQDLVRIFGVPSTKTLDPSGRVVMTWVYSKASTKPQTFVPVAGPFIGGMNTHVQQLTVLVDKKGRVESYTMNDAPGEVKYGRSR